MMLGINRGRLREEQLWGREKQLWDKDKGQLRDRECPCSLRLPIRHHNSSKDNHNSLPLREELISRCKGLKSNRNKVSTDLTSTASPTCPPHIPELRSPKVSTTTWNWEEPTKSSSSNWETAAALCEHASHVVAVSNTPTSKSTKVLLVLPI